MEERRKCKRMDMEAQLMVKRLDSTVKHAVVIDLIDVSRSGVGFIGMSEQDALRISVYEKFSEADLV